jgi:V/A-type H+-transporting ATPase subunit C
MIGRAKDYGFLNVRMRAQRQKLLSAGNYNVLVMATDVDNLRQMLNNTRYKDIIGSQMEEKYLDLIDIDRRLTQYFVDQYNYFKQFVPKKAQSFVDALSKQYFLNNVKIILTALHGTTNLFEARSLLISLSPEEDEEIDDLIGSKDIKDLVSRLSNEDLQDALNEALPEYQQLDLVYPLLNAIDHYFYNILCEEMSKLQKRDQEQIQQIYSVKIDLQNIETILRSKALKVDPILTRKWLILQGCTLSKKLFDKLIKTTDLEETFRILRRETPYRDVALRLLANLEEDQPPLDNYSQICDQLIAHKANDVFRGNSFNIAIFPAYFILKEIEIRNIRSIILGKIDKRPTEEVFKTIILV